MTVTVASVAAQSRETSVVDDAWSLANAIGQYQFTTTLVQTTRPLPDLANAGLTPTVERLYIEGTTDMPKQALSMKLWSQGGTSIAGTGALEMQVDDGVAKGRVDGSDWQAMDDVSGLFAPNQDPLGFLNAATDMRPLGREQRDTGLTVDRYQFDIDGPQFASFMRDKARDELSDRGELPLGMQMSVDQRLASIEATGEVWLDTDGLPVRQVIEIVFPEEGLEQISAEITTDFQAWGDVPTQTAVMFGLRDAAEKIGDHAPAGVANASVIALAMVFSAFLILQGGTRQAQRLIGFACAAMFIITPLLQATDAHAMGESFAAFRAEHAPPADDAAADESDEAVAALTELRAQAAATTIVPPAALYDNGTDTDGDGLTDAVELEITGSSIDNVDSDGDGLEDGAEVHQLGTDPVSADTDNDLLSDGAEVRGYADVFTTRWNLDPLAADSNGDGTLDGMNCTDTNGVLSCIDSDGDNVANVFDDDDDNDGVPDSVDNDTLTHIGSTQTGLADKTLKFDINGLAVGETALVDFQLRPTNSDHLWYSLSILDWPVNDYEGQVTRVNDTTFGNSGSEANGDLRLTPLLEIEVAGNSSVLPLTNAKTSISFPGVVPGSATFEQQGADIALSLNLATGTAYNVAIYAGSCADVADGTAILSSTFDNVAANATVSLPNLRMSLDFATGRNVIKTERRDNGATSCRLIPNIVDNGYPTQMVDLEALGYYGISAREVNLGGGVYLYLPLALVYDEAGNQPVAFAGRMFYDPISTAFGPQQKARLLWTVNALTDRCTTMPTSFDPDPSTTGDDDESESDKVDAWCSDPANWIDNGARAVHAYYDDWFLTGMSVQRNISFKAAAIYQDPAYTTAQSGFTANGFGEDALWMLSQGLDASFLAGRTSGGVRDLTVDTAKSRWDKRTNAAVSTGERFTLPQEAFYVDRFDYEDERGLSDLAHEQAYQILDQTFTAHAGSLSDTTILYLQENTFRRLSLDQSDLTNVNGNALTLNATDANLPVAVTANMNWAPYRFTTGAWEPYPIEEYWNSKGVAIKAALGNEVTADEIEGAAYLARSYYVGLANGFGQLVEADGALGALPNALADVEMSAYLYEGSQSVNLSVGKAIKTAASKILKIIKLSIGSEAIVGDFGGFVKPGDFGSSLLEKISAKNLSFKTLLRPEYKGLVERSARIGKQVDSLSAAGLVLAVASAALSVIAAAVKFIDADAAKIISIIAKVMAVAATIIGLITASLKAIGMLAINTLKTLLKGISFKTGAIVFAAIGVAISVGFFIYEAVSSNLALGSTELNRLFIELVASIAVVIVLLVISTIPIIGPLIAGIIYLIDAVIGAICALVPPEEDGSDATAREYGCAGIAGLLAKVFTWTWYNNQPIIEMDRSDRLDIANLDYQLEIPQNGFAAGNRLRVSADIDTALYHNNIDDIEEFSFYVGWRWMFSALFEKRTTLTYQFTESKVDVHDSIDVEQQVNLWQAVNNPPADFFAPEAEFYRRESLSYLMNTPLSAGLAYGEQLDGLPLYITEGQAYLEQECVAICWLRTKKDTMHIDVSSLTNFDVFPATLTEFHTLTESPVDDAYRLAWDRNFPSLLDADGDGLRTQAVGGNDPDDSNPDSDNDGLSDWYEISTSNTDPLLLDTDGDGLCDGQELIYSTDPTRADSDSDGLLDSEEVFHRDLCDSDGDSNIDDWAGGWYFVYDYDGTTALDTLVTSDPLSADADNDGYLDSVERLYGFNPNVPSNGKVLEIAAAVNNPFVAPGGLLNYDVTVTNSLNRSYALGLLDVSFNADVQAETVNPIAFDLDPLEEATTTGTVKIRSDIAQSQVVSMTNHAGAIIADSSGLAKNRSLWLKLDTHPPASSQTRTYFDQTGNNHTFSCSTRCPINAFDAAYWNSAARFNNNLNYLESSSATVAGFGIAPNGFTVDTWVYLHTADGMNDMDLTVMKIGDLRLTVSPSFLRVSNNSAVIASTLSSGTQLIDDFTWTRITWRYVDQTVALYINGVKKREVAINLDAALEAAADSPLLIGEDDLVNQFSFFMTLDEVSVYPYGRPDGDIVNEYKTRVFYLNGTSTIAPGAIGPDNSIYGNDLKCYNDYGNDYGSCPSLTSGYAGTGFDVRTQDDYFPIVYEAQETPILDLSRHGEFTLAAWVNYANGSSYGTDWLMGASNDSTGQYFYPSLRASAFEEASGPESRQLVVALTAGIRGADGRTCEMQANTFFEDSDPMYEQLSAGNEWHHFTVTFDGTQFYAYINAVPLPITYHVSGMTPPPNSFCDGITPISHSEFLIGGKSEILNEQYSDGNFYSFVNEETMFNGLFDEVQIFNHALSAEQVDDIYWDETPILDLRFDEAPTASVFEDKSLVPNTVTCTGNACPTSGLPGRDNQAIRLEDNSQSVEMATLGALQISSGDFTIATWVKRDDPTAAVVLEGNGGTQFQLSNSASGVPFAQIGGATLTASSALGVDEWHHVMLHYKQAFSKTVTLYVDGVQEAQVTNVDPNLSGATPLRLRSTGGVMVDHLQVYRDALTTDEIADLLKQVPIVNLHLNEGRGTTSLENSAESTITATCISCELGVQGRMYDAGKNIKVAVDASASQALNLETYTAGLWVRPEGKQPDWQLLMSKATPNETSRNLSVYISPNSMLVHFSVQLDDCSTFAFTDSLAPLTANTWNHVMVSYDGSLLRLYINGSLDSSVAAPSICTSGGDRLSIGESETGTRTFIGDIDEVVVYPSVLSNDDVNDLFKYQLAWYDVEVETRVVVDADLPVISLPVNNTWLTDEDRVLVFVANDATSEVGGMYYRVFKNGTLLHDYENILDSTDATWPFTFRPAGSGVYRIEASARDLATNWVTTNFTVYVDGEGPALGEFLPERIAANPVTFNQATQTWDLAGAIGFYEIAGAPLDRIQVRMTDELGDDDSGWANAEFNSVYWSQDFPFEIRPNGSYTLTAQAWDTAGNQTTRSAIVNVDGTPPTASMIVAGGEDLNIETGTLLSGALTETGTIIAGVESLDVAFYPLNLHDESGVAYAPNGNIGHFRLDDVDTGAGSLTFADSSLSELRASCGNCPVASGEGRVNAAMTFDGINDSINVSDLSGALTGGAFTVGAWINPSTAVGASENFLSLQNGVINVKLDFWHQSSGQGSITAGYVTSSGSAFAATQDTFSTENWYFVLATVAASGALELYVDGKLQASTTLPSVPDGSSQLHLGGANGSHFSGAVDEVVLYDGVLPVAALATLSRAGAPALRLDFEEFGRDAGDLLFDVSRNGLQVKQRGTSVKLASGAVGGISAEMALNTQLTIPATSALDLSDGEFTQMAWIHPESNGNIFGSDGAANARYPFWNIVNNSDLEVGFGNGAAQLAHTVAGVVTPNAWSFIATTFDGTSYRTYLNGVLFDTTSTFAGQSPAVASGLLEIGSFVGMLDEVQVVRQVYSVGQISAEYAKGWQAANVITTGRSSSAEWSYNVPDVPGGLYEIRLRSSDKNGNYSLNHNELPSWEGAINDVTEVPVSVSVSASSTGTTSFVFWVLLAATVALLSLTKRQSGIFNR